MISKLRSGLTYANVMATVALFLALGGGAYAAFKVPRNSVGHRQIKKNAVDSAKVKDGTLRARDFKRGQLPAGQPGPAGADGHDGAPGAPGAPGQPGQDGASFTLATTVKSGQTETGVFAMWGGASAYMGGPVNFRVPFAQAFDQSHVHFMVKGAAFTTSCPGHGMAAAGHLCVYEREQSNRNFFGGDVDKTIAHAGGLQGADANGFSMGEVAGAGLAWSYGDWAATAP